MNTNCLTDFACPQCGEDGRFKIEATSIFTMTDEGSEDYTDVNWEGDSYCECAACHHSGRVKDFTDWKKGDL